MDVRSLCCKLKQKLAGPLPGIEIQKSMLPQTRNSRDYHTVPSTALEAAVLLLLMIPGKAERNSEKRGPRSTSSPVSLSNTVIPMIQRVEDGRAHGGQIALPGGVKKGDELFPVETALREAEEEIGIFNTRDRVTVLGKLSPLYIPVSNFVMWPVVACTDRDHHLAPQPEEVSRIICITIDELLRTIPAQSEFISRGVSVKAPCYQVGEVEIWGATAMVLAEFLWACGEIPAQE